MTHLDAGRERIATLDVGRVFDFVERWTYPPSRRVKDSLKIAIAIAIIYAISFYFGWDKAYWATVSAASVNLLSAGLTLWKGLLRTTGALVGGFLGLAIIAMFPQERWSYLLASTLLLGFFAYGTSGPQNWYFFAVAGITLCVIMAVAQAIPNSDSGTAHKIVMLRVTQTWMGSLVMVLVTVYIWPVRTVGQFEDLVRKGWQNQHRLYGAYRRLLFGETTIEETKGQKFHVISDVEAFVPRIVEDVKELRLEDAKFQLNSHIILHGAEQDTLEMLEVGHHWHHFLHLTIAQMEALETLRETMAENREIDVRDCLSGLDVLCDELDQRFVQIDRLLAREDPTQMPRPVALSVDEAELAALTNIQAAALATTKAELEKLDHTSREIFDTLAEIRLVERPRDGHEEHAEHGSHGGGLYIDPDRLRNIGAICLAWVAGFLIWVYVWDVPNDTIFVAMTGIMAILIAAMGIQFSLGAFFGSWALGAAVAIVCFILIMQHLPGYFGFGAMIIVAVFGMFYVFFNYWHTAFRMLAVASFMIVLDAHNEQAYDVDDLFVRAAWIGCVMTIAAVARAVFFHVRPDRTFMRQLDHFFRQADFLVSEATPDRVRKQGIVARWKRSIYANGLVDTAQKLALTAEEINYKELPGTTLEQVQELTFHVHALAYRVKALVEAREAPGTEPLEEQLADERRAWHEVIEQWFRHRPGLAQADVSPATLLARLDRLETQIEAAMARAGQGVSRADHESRYRLLGSYRGLAEAAISYAGVARGFNWSLLRETRF